MDLVRNLKNSPWGARILHHFPPGQFSRYLVVGVVNTLFGYGTYAAFTALLTPHVPFAYVVAGLVSSVFGITFSFFAYKWFIFKTRGNYLREWSRCILVYGGLILLSAAILPVTVFLVRHLTPARQSAPYIAGAIHMGAITVLGFLGHKSFSFAPAPDDSQST
jgi:putative flippase GtrA